MVENSAILVLVALNLATFLYDYLLYRRLRSLFPDNEYFNHMRKYIKHVDLKQSFYVTQMAYFFIDHIRNTKSDRYVDTLINVYKSLFAIRVSSKDLDIHDAGVMGIRHMKILVK